MTPPILEYFGGDSTLLLVFTLPWHEMYFSEGKPVKTKLITQKQNKKLFFRNNVNIEAQGMKTILMEIQGNSRNIMQDKPNDNVDKLLAIKVRAKNGFYPPPFHPLN